jgi:cyanophycinase
MPERRATLARQTLRSFSLQADVLPVLTREQAGDPLACAQVESAGCIYLTGGEPRVLRDVLHDTALWHAVTAQNTAGVVLVAAGGAAAALGAYGLTEQRPTLPAFADQTSERFDGLGLLPEMAILPYANWLRQDLIARIAALCPPGTLLVAIDRTAALVRTSGGWRVEGSGTVTFWRGGDLLHTIPSGQHVPPVNLLTS